MNESYSVKADLKVCKERGRAADPRPPETFEDAFRILNAIAPNGQTTTLHTNVTSVMKSSKIYWWSFYRPAGVYRLRGVGNTRSSRTFAPFAVYSFSLLL